MRLDYAPEGITLKVLDAGKGFDPNEPLSPPQGWGLEGMRERVASVSGQLNLDRLEALLAKHSRDAVVFLCGPPPMIVHVRKHLIKLGFSKKNIKQELFGL